MTDNDVHEPDEQLVARASEVLAGIQQGTIVGIVSICFLTNGNVHVQVEGPQNLLVRLGALTVCADVMKLIEQQRAQAQQNAQWAPGGNAQN